MKWCCCPGLLWQAGYKGHTHERVEYSLRKVKFWGYFLWFSSPLHLAQGRRAFCPYLAKIRSVAGTVHECFLSVRLIFYVMRAQWAKGYIWMQEIPAFPSLSLLPGPFSFCLFILSTGCEERTHWKRSWSWERLKAGGEGANRGWDGWMASLTQWTWAWASSGRWWRTGKPGVL